MTEPTPRCRDGRGARFAAVLATTWAAHNVGDHIVQTDHQAAGKATSGAAGWRAMAGHVSSYHAVQLAALLLADRLLGLRLRPTRVAAALVVSAGTHALPDRRWPVRRVLQRTGSPGFADLQAPLNGPYLADQALHHGALWVAALIASGGRDD